MGKMQRGVAGEKIIINIPTEKGRKYTSVSKILKAWLYIIDKNDLGIWVFSIPTAYCLTLGLLSTDTTIDDQILLNEVTS